MSAEGSNMILREQLQEQRETILFLAKLLAKAHTERDHARDIACKLEAKLAQWHETPRKGFFHDVHILRQPDQPT